MSGIDFIGSSAPINNNFPPKFVARFGRIYGELARALMEPPIGGLRVGASPHSSSDRPSRAQIQSWFQA